MVHRFFKPHRKSEETPPDPTTEPHPQGEYGADGGGQDGKRSKPSTNPSKPSTKRSKPSTKRSKPSTEPSKPSTERSSRISRLPTHMKDVRKAVEKQTRRMIEKNPRYKRTRAFWQSLYEMRDWWGVMLPLSAWVGWRTYRKERRKVVEQRHRAQKATTTSPSQPEKKQKQTKKQTKKRTEKQTEKRRR